MTHKQKELIIELRHLMLISGYQPVYHVDEETLEAVETAILEWKKERGLPEIVECGEYGPWFKGCQLMLQVGL